MNVLLCVLLLSQASGQDESRAVRNRYNRLLDTSADVLEPGEHQVAALFGEYTLGVLPRLQLSSHLAGVLVSYVNLTAKVQLVKRDDLMLSLSAGGGWLALAQLLGLSFVSVPVDLRATLPLGKQWEVSLGPSFRGLALQSRESSIQSLSVATEVNWVRYDTLGAWYLKGNLPLLSYQRSSFRGALDQPLVGDLLLDDVSAVSVLVGRDLLLGDHVHLRGGIGYRNRPGLVLIQSLGPLLLELNFYIRWGGPSKQDSGEERRRSRIRENTQRQHSL